MTLILLSSNDLSLAPQKDVVKTVLTEKLDLVSTVSAYAHSMTQSVLNPATTPPEAWFNTLSTNLSTAKVNAQKWLVLAPQIAARVPGSITGFNVTFQVAVRKINDVLTKVQNERRPFTAAEKTRVLDLIEMILETLDEQKTRVDGVAQDLVTVSGLFVADHKNLTDGQNGAAAALKLAESERADIEARITELQGKLESARRKLLVSDIGFHLSIMLVTVAIAFAAVTGGVGLGVLVAGGVGLVGIGGSIYAKDVFTSEVDALAAQVAEKQKALDDKKKQVTALTGIINTVGKLKTDNETARKALTDIQSMWSTLDGKLQEVMTKIKSTSSATETLMSLRLSEAEAAWKDVAEFAQNIQNAASGTRVDPPLLHKSLRAA
jgi:archaellum component FlaC